MEFRTTQQRIEDLEHDNNVLRDHIAELWSADSMLRASIERDVNIIEKKVNKLVDAVNDFIGRFGRVN